MVKIASWNVNSIKARLPNVTEWLKSAEPDLLLLQELKTTEDGFPYIEIEATGYKASVVGQKSYNGVAVLSRTPIDKIRIESLPGDKKDEQARYLEVEAGGLIVASIYLPNGNPVDTDKYDYKLAWMDRLIRHARMLLEGELPVVLGGDYNVIPSDEDCYDPTAWRNDALFRVEVRKKFRELLALGYADAFRCLHPRKRAYSFWDYQGGAWQNDHGLRIDHLLLSPQATDHLAKCEIDSGPRGKDKASDHTPIWCELD